jgi:hypothetical protein
MTTSVPSIQFTPTGVVVPDQSAVLAGVQADLNAAFGGRLNFGTPTQPGGAPPQVQQATSYAAIINDANGVIAELVDQVDPDNATGFMQDAIGRIYFMNRQAGAPTVVTCLCGGGLGTEITAGVAQAIDTSGNIYICTGTATIDASGFVTTTFANVKVGPIPCPAGTLNRIYAGVTGWSSVTNPADGVIGRNVETAAEFEFRRQNSVAANAHGSLPAIYGAVFDVADVLDAYAAENKGDNPIVIGSTDFTLVGHSFVISVTGGTDVDIANAIWTKKNEGSNMNGNTTETITDNSGYSFPQPTYPITFLRPTPTAYDFQVNIVNSAALPATIIQDVQAAITAQFNGTNANGARVRIGSLLLAATFYGPVATCEGPSVPVQVLSIFLGNPFTGTATIVNGSKVITVATVAGSGKITPGNVLTGTGIQAGTTIVKQLTGTAGGAGTYQMSAAATATVGAPEAISGAGGTAQLIGVDQQPIIGVIKVNLI